MRVNDGGLAFPTDCGFAIDGEPVLHSVHGMSLRDWFAGMALQAVYISESLPFFQAKCAKGLGCPIFTEHANSAYRLADAMLAEREKGGAK